MKHLWLLAKQRYGFQVEKADFADYMVCSGHTPKRKYTETVLKLSASGTNFTINLLPD